MRNSKKIVIAGIFSSFLLVSFQNCSKSHLGLPLDASKSIDMEEFNSLIDLSATIGINPDDAIDETPATENTTTSSGSLNVNESAETPSMAAGSIASSPQELEAEVDSTNQVTHGVDLATVCSDIREIRKRLYSEKKKLRWGQSTVVIVDGEIENISGRGKHIYINGNETNLGRIHKVTNYRGKLILCGFEVDQITNTKGRLDLVNSNVKSQTKHRGVVRAFYLPSTDPRDLVANKMSGKKAYQNVYGLKNGVFVPTY